MLKFIVQSFIFLIVLNSCKDLEKPQTVMEVEDVSYYTEPYRPQFHFSPQEMWMNDPNGLVYHKGIYHLFYQYYPEDIVWGPMHWGHATSEDLLHWKQKPIALFPDEHGYIFSGSAVVDKNNTSGFGSEVEPPLVAIYTYHNMEGEKAGKENYQTQGIAYSLDNGESWTKYADNPVIGNEGFKDFRDPKVFWNNIKNIWTMLLVAGDHLQIWNSSNLKKWEKVSEFGKDKGAHGGVWECPDLFQLQEAGSDEEKWVLLISINPGAPNGGSGTQYFIGDFDGTTFTTDQEGAKWIDLGRDNYAGVTYNNTPNNERIFIGWMSNWNYARDTPTEVWRSAMTIPRNLSLKKINGEFELYNYPVPQLDNIIEHAYEEPLLELKALQKTQIPLKYGNQSEIIFNLNGQNSKWYFSNTEGDSLMIQLDNREKIVWFDRSKSGKVDFKKEFVNGKQQMPIPNLPDGEFEVRILLDQSSLELFLNQGQYVMTNQVFPNTDYTELTLENLSDTEMKIDSLSESKVMRVWD
ncbi:glycoside hydrolase family 32 protein [Maribacter sp. PR1]|uniref:Glycoside hydrolase family 32 protein n=1 Tax=Maribacter cobaltidurans TaxID=1178778 RepID=A0ABU7IVM0_9FLAO|nr:MULTISPECIES: glycoside hydrolase family 32 protein [Maribacter]MDC6389189.1 glycoside hydrolase family 32 protein [Maribacter sp. PR1]MEE1976576.1 glycoside hydrolase family 32 protein [Maribacter cobaltidurans]